MQINEGNMTGLNGNLITYGVCLRGRKGSENMKNIPGFNNETKQTENQIKLIEKSCRIICG